MVPTVSHAELGCDCSTQWAEHKAILRALANILFDEPYYIFLNSWTPANGLATWSAIWKTTDWQIKGTLLRGHEMWQHIMAANQTIWVAPVDAHSKSLCSDETSWNQAFDGDCNVQIATIAAHIHHLARHGNISTIMNNKQSKILYVTDAEATTTCQTYVSCQKVDLFISR